MIGRSITPSGTLTIWNPAHPRNSVRVVRRDRVLVNSVMRKNIIFAGSVLLTIACFRLVSAADTPGFAGEYADKRFLNGQAVFQMSIEQHGNTASVWFSAGYNDGHGSAPEGEGKGNVTGKDVLEFAFKDGE